jgi:hypothetical protein
MGPINLQVRYRPIRIGWCVKEDDLAELQKALRLAEGESLPSGGTF